MWLNIHSGKSGSLLKLFFFRGWWGEGGDFYWNKKIYKWNLYPLEILLHMGEIFTLDLAGTFCWLTEVS